ncbi:MAG TPA: response regulator [Nitrospiraceae bacterium]|nr:response regulator [Nitrospiraceae bacterium]
MTEHTKSFEELERENDSLRTRLEEVSEVLTAIRAGTVDALVVEGSNGEQVFTLEGADYPYRIFLESMNEGAVTLAMDGTIVYCNRRFADLVGTILEQTFGRPFLDFVVCSDQPAFDALMAQGNGVSVRSELSLEQPYGTAIPVQLSAQRLSQKGSDYWCLVVTDLRKQKLHDALRESEERLRTFTAKLEQRVEERTRELVVSQERLRALANELNRTELRERKRMAAELHDHLAQLLALSIMKLAQVKNKRELTPASNNLVNKVQELLVEGLNYTRTLVTDLSPPMLHDLGLLPALNWLAEQMQRHQLAVTVEIPQGGDELKLSEDQALLLFQSVRELLINSIKHSGACEATVSCAWRDGTVRLEVRDRGKGFDVYTKTRSNSSTHFGLFSINERMQALGGSLELESAVGIGTRATLVLPLTSATAVGLTANAPRSDLSASALPSQPFDRSTEPGHAHVTTATSMQPIRVLLVDDHAMVRQGLRTVLDSYADIQIVGEASNGEEALVGVATHQPSIVVMDINMPKMNGIEATAAIRNSNPEINVIGLSVQSGGEIQQAMLKAGADVLLTKEAAVDQLYKAIQTVRKGETRAMTRTS